MSDPLDSRLAILRLTTELRQATARAERVLEGGDHAEMLAALIDLSHSFASVAIMGEALSRDLQGYAERAEAAEARQRQSARGALRDLVVQLAQRASSALRERA